MSQPDSSSTAIASFNITSQSQRANLTARSRGSLLVRRLMVAIVLIFVTISVVNFIAWRIIRPLPPVFEVKSFNISASPPRFDILFNVTNPNKKLSLAMDRFEILLFQGKTRVVREWMFAAAGVPVLCLDKNNSRDFPVHERVLQLRNKTEVNFNVKMNVKIRFLAWNWLPKREVMEVFCGGLRSSAVSPERKCSIHIV